ncbi:MAG: choloylglycine hydrolase family protein [Desulfobacteraceae bacterium]|nr:choloylglycine hydrolase family protein [Desulfobacteraceae bacterium]
MRKTTCLISFSIFVFAILVTEGILACTGFTVKAKDGSVVFGRSLEWGANDMESEIIIIPRGKKYTGTAGKGLPGLKWAAKYGIAGMNILHLDNAILDGVNEKGLYGGAFFFPGFAEYRKITNDEADRAMAPWEFLTWVLTSFASVDEARKEIPQIMLVNSKFPPAPIDVTVHYILVDHTGKSIVIEPIGGKLKISDNPLGIITNAPDFEWHILNLNNYVKISPYNAEPEVVDGVTIKPFGQGSGLIGLPGDYTPPSRFVRAFVLSKASLPAQNSKEATSNALRILNAFYIVKGYVRDKAKDQTSYDFTQWETITDLANRKIFFRTYDNPAVLRMVDLNRLNFDADQIKKIPIKQKMMYLDITDRAK